MLAGGGHLVNPCGGSAIVKFLYERDLCHTMSKQRASCIYCAIRPKGSWHKSKLTSYNVGSGRFDTDQVRTRSNKKCYFAFEAKQSSEVGVHPAQYFSRRTFATTNPQKPSGVAVCLNKWLESPPDSTSLMLCCAAPTYST